MTIYKKQIRGGKRSEEKKSRTPKKKKERQTAKKMSRELTNLQNLKNKKKKKTQRKVNKEEKGRHFKVGRGKEARKLKLSSRHFPNFHLKINEVTVQAQDSKLACNHQKEN